MNNFFSLYAKAGLFVMFMLIPLFSITEISRQEEGRNISYVESSSGLEVPNWEGGRTELEMGDVDQDGNVDILSIGDHGNPLIQSGEEGIMVWFGDGRGSWSHYQTGHFGYGGIAIGDVNNDGYMDIGYGMHHDYSSTDLGDQIFEVALGDGTGLNWTAWDDGLATNGETWGMFNTDFADVDNDGDLDVGSISFGCCAGIHVYINNGNGTWTQSFGFTGGNSNMQFYFGDVNADGNADIVTSHAYGTVYLGDGSGGFRLAEGNLPPYSEYDARVGAHLGDVDNDGDQDLSYVNQDGGIDIWLWNGSNTWVDGSGSLPDTGNYDATQLYDMDMDGNMDVSAMGDDKITVWGGDGSGSWTQLTEFTFTGSHEAFRVGADADHNGYPDIVFLSEQGSWPNYQNYLHFYKENSSTSSLNITPMYPRGNETFNICSIRFIDWISGIPLDEDFGTVTLELSTDGPSGPWNLISDNLPNNGRYQWTVSSDKFSADCYVRYTVANSKGSSSAVTPIAFEVGLPELRITLTQEGFISWEGCSDVDDYNVYRSDWDHFMLYGEYTQDPSSVPNAGRYCNVSLPPFNDNFEPSDPGEMVFYLVNANKGGTESDLGYDSGGTERPNDYPCTP